MRPQADSILVVNDNEPGRYVTARILSRAGFKVLEAATGTDGLRIAHQEQPKVVVLDVNLPDVNGIEVCRRLKSAPSTASILVLQISATNIAVADRVEALLAGADSFLVEPVQPEELEAVTRALLRLHNSERALRAAIEQRDLLLKEVNHRVKNSLQLVLSMLSLQSNEFTDPHARGLFLQAISRITAIASVHERLYQENDPVTVDMQGYLSNLCAELERAGSSDARRCTLDVQVESVRLPTEFGVSLALIVNELVTNALKHGRPAAGAASVQVRLQRQPNDRLQLQVADNGSGTSASSQEQSGLGTRLIAMLVRQLKGQLQIEDSPHGHCVSVDFPGPVAVTPGQSPSA